MGDNGSAIHERDEKFCPTCKQRYSIRINPGYWETTMCHCGCLVKKWDREKKSYRGATFYPRRICKSQFERAQEFEDRVINGITITKKEV